jgi:hypothetical protein
MDPLSCYQEVEPAGAEKGKKAKTKPITIREVSIIDLNAWNELVEHQ